MTTEYNDSIDKPDHFHFFNAQIFSHHLMHISRRRVILENLDSFFEGLDSILSDFAIMGLQ